jgi:hypothetical protein
VRTWVAVFEGFYDAIAARRLKASAQSRIGALEDHTSVGVRRRATEHLFVKVFAERLPVVDRGRKRNEVFLQESRVDNRTLTLALRKLVFRAAKSKEGV